MFPIHDENPVKIIPYVTYALMAACIGAFLWQISRSAEAQHAIVYALGVTPAVIFDHRDLPEHLVWVPEYATVFTSMFLHGGWMHLIGNMLYLWVFGNNIECAMGHIKYIVFYIVCGIAAVLAQALPDTDSVVPMIGASGAISGVLGAYLLLYPRATVTLILPILVVIKTFKLPAMIVLGGWFVMQLVSSAMSTGEGGGVAFGAHIGGFIAGMLLVGLFKSANIPLQIPFVHFHPWKS